MTRLGWVSILMDVHREDSIGKTPAWRVQPGSLSSSHFSCLCKSKLSRGEICVPNFIHSVKGVHLANYSVPKILLQRAAVLKQLKICEITNFHCHAMWGIADG